MSEFTVVSINLTEAGKAVKAGHSSVWKNKDGEIFINVKISDMREPDKMGNTVSVSMNSHKDKKEDDKKISFKNKGYLGNGKKFKFENKHQQNGTHAPENPSEEDKPSDLPF